MFSRLCVGIGFAGLCSLGLAFALAAEESDVPVKQVTMTRRLITPSSLPKPYATKLVDHRPLIAPRPEGACLNVPPGFTAHLWASGLTNPRIITTAPNGDVFVAESRANRVTVLRDADSDGKPEARSVFAENLVQPFGIAFYPPGPSPAYVYIANTNSVARFPYKSGDLKASGSAETVVAELPGFGYRQHWTRNLVFRPDGKKMFISVGSSLDVGEEEEKRAAILEYNPDGTGYRLFATGLRNPSGLAFHPPTGTLWTAVNERDQLGDDLVPDFFTQVKEGGFYGWPYYYIGANHDPRMPEKPALKTKSLVPDVLFMAHVSALGVEFYTGKQFPPEYRNQAFVAQHGSGNRSTRVGYAIARVPVSATGKADGSYEDFVTGWATPDGTVWGRPVDVAVAADGSLLISDDGDDKNGKIWRVRYIGTTDAHR